MSHQFHKDSSEEENHSASITHLHRSTQQVNEIYVALSQDIQYKDHEERVIPRPFQTERELPFISYCKYYELLKTYGQIFETKQEFPFANLVTPNGNLASYFICFCGSRLCERRYLVKHWEYMHGTFFESLEYMVAYANWTKCGLPSKLFPQQKLEYLRKVRQTPYQLLALPEDLKFIVPIEQRRNILSELRALIKFSIQDQNFYFKQQQGKLNYRRSNLYSQQFMEAIREILLKYFTVFNRNIIAFLHNATIKEFVLLLIWNLLDPFSSIKQDKKKKRTNDIQTIAKLIECIGWHFCSWVNMNYQRVFNHHNVFYSHIELQETESYAETQRPWKFELFSFEYLRNLQQNNIQKNIIEIVKFLMAQISHFHLHTDEQENLIVPLSSKKIKRR